MSYTSKFTGAEIDAGIEAANAALPKSGGEMSGTLEAPTVVIQATSGHSALQFQAPDASAPKAFLYYDDVNNRLYFVETASDTNYIERYLIPIPSTGLTTNKNYHFLTTKQVQVGRATVGTSGVAVTFPNAFSGVPVVTASGSLATHVSVSDVSATGFTLTSGLNDNSVQWQAIYIS